MQKKAYTLIVDLLTIFSIPLTVARPASLPTLHLQVNNKGPQASRYQQLQPQPCGVPAITAKTLAMSKSSRNSSTIRKPRGTCDTWHMKKNSSSFILLQFLVRLFQFLCISVQFCPVLSVLVLVLLSAHVARFSVFHMDDFIQKVAKILKTLNITTFLCEYLIQWTY